MVQFRLPKIDRNIEDLSSYLDKASGAVLVKRDDASYEIITKSDLIRALAATGKTLNNKSNGHINE